MNGDHRAAGPLAFSAKDDARAAVWRALDDSGATAFPRPARGRIPNFVGSAEAAARLREHALYRSTRAIKVNPDYAQHAVRANALRDGKIVYMPTPRLRASIPAGFAVSNVRHVPIPTAGRCTPARPNRRVSIGLAPLCLIFGGRAWGPARCIGFPAKPAERVHPRL